jgi:signal transduction histidine kinase
MKAFSLRLKPFSLRLKPFSPRLKPCSLRHDGVRYVLTRLGLAAAISAVAAVVAMALWSDTPPSPFLLAYPAVVLAAWWGGRIAGVATMVLTTLALAYFFLPPMSSLAVEGRRDALDLALFCGVSLLLTHFITRMRRALRRTQDALREAEAATAAKETVLAVVAHDLRNPLQTIGLGTELLAREIGHEGEPVNEQIARIRRCAERARRLVDNILDSARIGANPFPIASEEWLLPDLIDEALSPFEPIAGTRGIQLDLPDPSTIDGSIICDRDRIAQVLSNLVGNALQYTARGGRVAVDVRRTPNVVQFSVADTGVGMTRDELDHAFERQWRGQGPGHGSGLGLWIVKALVEAHGGRVAATSEPHKGTTMMFSIPSNPAGIRIGAPSPPLIPAHAGA